jgi:hypothetical protein
MSLLLIELNRLTEFLLFIASRAAILATVLARHVPFFRFVFQARHGAGPIGGSSDFAPIEATGSAGRLR